MLAMLVLISARLARPDTHLFFIWANAYTFWIYLPAYPVAALAGAFRRWAILGMAGVAVAFHLAWVLPDYGPAEDIPAGADSAPRLRLMTANVFFGNEDFSGIASEILEVDPDVLFLQEFGAVLQAELRESGVEARYPYREVVYENRYFGSSMYSKFPLSDVSSVDAGGRPLLRATVQVGGIDVRLYELHPTSPAFGRHLARDWNDGWKVITAELAAESGPVIVAGDFNMTQHHKWYGVLKGDGFDNCHEERGRGNATSWPQQRKLRPVRIDQVFHSDEVVCLSIREGRGEGSDHKPLIAELAILPR